MNSNLLKFIKANTKFAGNEDLCDDFLAEAMRRSLGIVDGVEDITFLEAYLKKVVNTSILTVLKNSGRVRRVNQEYVSMKPVISLDDIFSSNEDDSESSFLNTLSDPKSDFTEVAASREMLSQVCDVVMLANNVHQGKSYYELFYKRYIEQKKQADIAAELGLSQSEVCKRLYELIQIIKKDVIGY